MASASAVFLIDTNVLLYAYDADDGNDGAVVEGVHFLNSFSATFDLTLLSR